MTPKQKARIDAILDKVLAAYFRFRAHHKEGGARKNHFIYQEWKQ